MVNYWIVDDARAIRTIISGMLSELEGNYKPASQIKTLENGAEFKSTLESSRLTEISDLIVFLDFNLPDMNGHQILDYLYSGKNKDKYNGVKVIMCTTESEIKKISQSLDKGAIDYIMKPFTKTILHDKVKKVVG